VTLPTRAEAAEYLDSLAEEIAELDAQLAAVLKVKAQVRSSKLIASLSAGDSATAANQKAEVAATQHHITELDLRCDLAARQERYALIRFLIDHDLLA